VKDIQPEKTMNKDISAARLHDLKTAIFRQCDRRLTAVLDVRTVYENTVHQATSIMYSTPTSSVESSSIKRLTGTFPHGNLRGQTPQCELHGAQETKEISL
jgi:hypothetical protein